MHKLWHEKVKRVHFQKICCQSLHRRSAGLNWACGLFWSDIFKLKPTGELLTRRDLSR